MLKFSASVTGQPKICKNAKTLGKAWRDLNPAIDESEDYDKFLPHYEKMLEATDTVNIQRLIADDEPRRLIRKFLLRLPMLSKKLCRCLSSLLPTSAPRQPTMC